MDMDTLYLGTAVPKYGTGVGYDYRQATRKSEERVEGSLHFNVQQRDTSYRATTSPVGDGTTYVYRHKG